MLNSFKTLLPIVTILGACTPIPNEIRGREVIPSTSPEPSEQALPQASPTPTSSESALPQPTPSPESFLPQDALWQRLSKVPLSAQQQPITPFGLMQRSQLSWKTQTRDQICSLSAGGELSCQIFSGFGLGELTYLTPEGLLATAGSGWSMGDGDISIASTRMDTTEWLGFRLQDIALSAQGNGYLLLDDARPQSKQTGFREPEHLEDVSLRYVRVQDFRPQNTPEIMMPLGSQELGLDMVLAAKIDPQGKGFVIHRSSQSSGMQVQYFSDLKPSHQAPLKLPASRDIFLDMPGSAGHVIWTEGQSIYLKPTQLESISEAVHTLTLDTAINFEAYLHPVRLDPSSFGGYPVKPWDILLDEAGHGVVIIYPPDNRGKILEIHQIEAYQVLSQQRFEVPDNQAIYMAKLLKTVSDTLTLVLLTGSCDSHGCVAGQLIDSPVLWQGRLSG